MDTDIDWSLGVKTSYVFAKISFRAQVRHIYLCLNKRPAHITIRSVLDWAHSPPRAFVVCLCTDLEDNTTIASGANQFHCRFVPFAERNGHNNEYAQNYSE